MADLLKPAGATLLGRPEQRRPSASGRLVEWATMITTTDVEIRAGARTLLDAVSFRVAAGDKVGLVGRNGAGKTTLTKVLAG